jgi:hypothetical protein
MTARTLMGTMPAASATVRAKLSSSALKMGVDCAMGLNRIQLAAMGAAGRDRMQREFSWDSVARKMGSAYQWLARQGPQPACIVTD